MSYRTIIVDDEPPALEKLRYLLKDYEDFELVGAYSNADDVLRSVQTIKPQAAFLDIAMPGKSGIELASIMRSQLSDSIKIVFVTAYDRYAVSAFDINATDYLMKPVSKERFRTSILRLKEDLSPHPRPAASEALSQAPMVHAFGKLEITNTPATPPEWRTAKVRELFALFLQNRPSGIFRKTLLETLWSDLPEEKALSNLNTCNYYLRKFLQSTGTDISLQYKSGYYSLDLGSVSCDIDLFEHSETLATSPSEQSIDDILYGVSLYRGTYFEDVKCEWANLLRDQYDMRYTKLQIAIAKYYESIGQLDKANRQATLALDIDPLCESAWEILLTNYKTVDNKTYYETTLSNRQSAYQNRGLPVPDLK